MIRCLAGYLAAVNIAAFVVYGLDKWQARRNGRRIAEVHLLGLVAAGGGPGAFCGQQVFRHKTRKHSFQLVFWGIIFAQTAILVWVWLNRP